MAVVALAGLLLAACSGAEEEGSQAEREPAPLELDLAVTSADLVTDTAPRTPLDASVRDEVAAVVADFLEASALAPVATGEVGEGLDALVTAEVEARLHGADEDALVDVGVPRADEVEVETAEVALAAVGTGAEVQLVVAELDLALRGLADDGSEAVHIRRWGELTLEPDTGGWRVAGYDLEVERQAEGAAVRS